MERVGVLTGGGDCPGLNAVIRAVVRRAAQDNIKIIGIKNGWKGLINMETTDLNMDSVSGILPKGGTILGTSRTNPFKSEDGAKCILKNVSEHGIEAVIAIGGEIRLA